MRIYLYNSYKGSPVGFIMGMMDEQAGGVFTEMTENGIPPFIRACFEHGIVKNVVGNIHYNKEDMAPKYLLLLKNLTFSPENAADDFTWYLNFALETDDGDLMEKWLATDAENDVACHLSQCLRIDKSDNFGYKVLNDKLGEFLKSSFASSAIPDAVKADINEGCCFNFQDKLPEKEQRKFLDEYQGTLPQKLTPLLSSPQYWVLAQKKSLKKRHYLAIAASLLIMLLAWIWVALDLTKKTPDLAPLPAAGRDQCQAISVTVSRSLEKQSSPCLVPAEKGGSRLMMFQKCSALKLTTRKMIETLVSCPACPDSLPGLLLYDDIQEDEPGKRLASGDKLSFLCRKMESPGNDQDLENCKDLIFCEAAPPPESYTNLNLIFDGAYLFDDAGTLNSDKEEIILNLPDNN